MRQRSSWPDLVPVDPTGWPLFAESYAPDKLDALLKELDPSVEAAVILAAFAPKM